MSLPSNNNDPNYNEQELEDKQQEKAATKIQAHFKGRKSRKEF